MSVPQSLRARLFIVAAALVVVFALCGATSQVSPSIASAQSFGNCSYLGSNYYWNGSICQYIATPATSCSYLGPNYYWNGSSCVQYGSNSCSYLGSNYYWNGSSCVYGTGGNCSYLGSNYYWNGSSCVQNYSNTSCSYLGSNYYWNGSSCVVTSANSCSYLGSNYYWNGSSCVLLNTGNCSYLGSNYYWNGSSCVLNFSNTSCSYLGPNYYWNGTSCVLSNSSNCSYLGSNYYWNGSSCVLLTANTLTSTVTYSPGWNIVGGPSGTVLTGTSSSLFSYPPGANAYVTLPSGTPFQAGTGYWAYFNTTTTVNLAPSTTSNVNVTLPAGQWVLIGNPGTGTATVTGASVSLFAYSPNAGGYSQVTTIPAGQGVWAISYTGGTVTISTGLAGGPPPPP